jgi:hypothetical protein
MRLGALLRLEHLPHPSGTPAFTCCLGHAAGGASFTMCSLPGRRCAAKGGHLTSYVSMMEQLEVEDQYITLGVLLPTFHLRYWIGLYIPYRDPKLWPGGPPAQRWDEALSAMLLPTVWAL